MSFSLNNAPPAIESDTVTMTYIAGVNSEGEIVNEALVRKRKNGGGFVLSYTDKLCDLAVKVPQASILRVFIYIAHHQQFGNNGVFGLRSSRKHLEEALNLNRKTVYDALKWLIDNFVVNELHLDGSREFMVNPSYVTVGTDKKARMREWNRRWQIYNIQKNQSAVR